ncbi:hypothetical protein Glove_65g41 [Diversispora epigaea]|uniref:Uncharacterized protein n=1 Tax=Diversispora epigaea TaxID=1348612 RepID=A0A397JAX9_9GLOM|nr:hypothetical protein Glove_65g41 [Diversispora epigaea]
MNYIQNFLLPENNNNQEEEQEKTPPLNQKKPGKEHQHYCRRKINRGDKQIDLPDFTLLTTSPRRRNRPLTVYVLPKSQIIWDLGRQNAQITSIWDLGFEISAKDTNYNLGFGIWDFGIWDFSIWILNLGGREFSSNLNLDLEVAQDLSIEDQPNIYTKY